MAVLGVFLLTAFLVIARPAPKAGSWDRLVDRFASEYGVDPGLVRAVIECESGGRVGAVSRAGALGLMQIMPSTASMIAAELDLPAPSRGDLFDPEINIRFGTYYLAKMSNRFENLHLALAAYNAGPANVRRWMAENPGASGAEVVKTSAYGETRHYVSRVLRAWKSRK
jgi:soluble lytic murein transglycosylase